MPAPHAVTVPTPTVDTRPLAHLGGCRPSREHARRRPVGRHGPGSRVLPSDGMAYGRPLPARGLGAIPDAGNGLSMLRLPLTPTLRPLLLSCRSVSAHSEDLLLRKSILAKEKSRRRASVTQSQTTNSTRSCTAVTHTTLHTVSVTDRMAQALHCTALLVYLIDCIAAAGGEQRE